MEKKYRYPGSKPFTEDDNPVFFGREDDIENLGKYITVHELSVLYGKSGLGKSSLLNAGVLPGLERSDKYRFIKLRLNSYAAETGSDPLSKIKSGIRDAGPTDSFLDEIEGGDPGLWQLVKGLTINNPEEYADRTILLIFDQFEELFTYPFGVENFAEELADLLNRRVPATFRDAVYRKADESEKWELRLPSILKAPDVKALFSIRSDKLNLLNRLSDSLPQVLHNCYELLPLSREQARLAVVKPAEKHDNTFAVPPFGFTPGALSVVLDFLGEHHGGTVEAFELQIICQHFEKHYAEAKNQQLIDDSDVTDLAYIVENYYEITVNEICAGDDSKRTRVNRLIEEGLIFEPEARRISMYKGQIIKNFEISETLLTELVNSHLLRGEAGQQGAYYYELCHDTLVGPILQARSRRLAEQRLASEEQKRIFKEKQVEQEAQEKLKKQRIDAKRQEEQTRRFYLRVAVTLLSVLLITIAAFSYNIYYKNKDLEDAITDSQKNEQEAITLRDMLKIRSDKLTEQNDELEKAQELLEIASESKQGELVKKIQELQAQLDNNQEVNNLPADVVEKKKYDALARKMSALKREMKRLDKQYQAIDKKTGPDNIRQRIKDYTTILRAYGHLQK